jgi:putative phosphoesterase
LVVFTTRAKDTSLWILEGKFIVLGDRLAAWKKLKTSGAQGGVQQMKRIGVLSDSHLCEPDPGLAARLARVFQGVDMIMHAGDITSLTVLDMLEAPEVIAVAGNMDEPVVRQTLPDQRVVEVEGKRLGLIHGWDSPFGLAGRVATRFSGVNCVVFGHSHRPMNAVVGGVLMFNPGSVSRGLVGSGTVGLLTVNQGVSGTIVKI